MEMENGMTMVERVAKAICAKEYEDPNELTNAYPDGPMYPAWKDFEWCARAAIEAMREPTEAMKGATYMRDWEALEIWQAMADAALKEQEGQK